MSETATCRERLAPFCAGNGLDIGAGGDPIVPWAICLDRAEADGRRAHVGTSPTQLVGDAACLRWFRDGELDFVYSSHCLEDFKDTAAVLREWQRVLRHGGRLVLFLPDQAAYLADCAAKGTLPNQAHIHAEFSLAFVKARLPSGLRVIHEQWPVPNNPYSFDLVCERDL